MTSVYVKFLPDNNYIFSITAYVIIIIIVYFSVTIPYIF